jgi:hypothetical protein
VHTTGNGCFVLIELPPSWREKARAMTRRDVASHARVTVRVWLRVGYDYGGLEITHRNVDVSVAAQW